MKKIFCFVLIILSLSFCFAGCGEKDESPEWAKGEIYGTYSWDIITQQLSDFYEINEKHVIFNNLKITSIEMVKETSNCVIFAGINLYLSTPYFGNPYKVGDIISAEGIFYSYYGNCLSPCIVLSVQPQTT